MCVYLFQKVFVIYRKVFQDTYFTQINCSTLVFSSQGNIRYRFRVIPQKFGTYFYPLKSYPLKQLSNLSDVHHLLEWDHIQGNIFHL